MSDSKLPARIAEVRRETRETHVRVSIDLDGSGEQYDNDTGIGFLDHMLDLFARHGGFDLSVRCEGDLKVDDHHTAEDVGITIGQAFHKALGQKQYVARYGHAYVPMDEALARAVVDLSGRFYLTFEADLAREVVGDLSTEMVRHFWHSFAEHVGCNLHVDLLRGQNAHHQVEAIFKACARALRMACHRELTHDPLPSTKGAL